MTITARANYLGEAGIVQSISQGAWEFLYRVSTVKDAKWNIGDKVVLPNGKTFRYCKSAGVCDTYKANLFFNAIPATGIDYSLLYADAAAGATSIQMTNQGTVAQTKDGLAGGHIDITEGDDGTNQQREVIGNTAGGVNDVITIYLDVPLDAAVTTSWYAYCMPSPYSAVVRTDGLEGAEKGKLSFVGYAAAKVTAADMFHWEQTAGQISCSQYGNVGKTIYFREVVFRYDGNIMHRGASGVTGLEAQTAGYILDNNAADNGATVIMLKLEP